MEIKIIKDEENRLLNRRDLRVSIDHLGAGTPKRIDLQNKLATQLGVKPELLFVTKIKTLTGKNSTLCNVQVYNDLKRAQLIVPEHVRTRGTPSEKGDKKEAATKGKEAPKEKEKPKEKAEKLAK